MSVILRLITLMLMPIFYSSACSYPQERLREFQQEIARQAAAPRTPEERCQRLGGVLNAGQCYTPSATALEERACRLRGGLYLNEQCLVSAQNRAAAP